MKREEIRILVYNYSSLEELSPGAQGLINEAREATKRAWSPYSGFSVGTAIELENGEIVTGNNQENAAFPSGLCAERVALFYAGSKYPGVPIKRMALAAYTKGSFIARPVFPCGDCRQALLEHEYRVQQPIELIMFGTSEIKVVKSVRDLLPLPFDYDLMEPRKP